ncbi:exosome complex component CSL4 [Nannochloropsis gaditana CCMP526]|uniref:exosome complex component CSL4 n=1 Tax=Nannochloropsis gaditana (strain CCMP526) TaxID=1093141 RepID=UPI00029F5279|nr:exosome complex component CSL4 [Nannochloropsis gaditana CCMP526]EKU21487.1 exosome complex component CSL4 [Nannochloropsis gaditana CCMP526]|eukprot:XP_005854879.1 exosome complex component CSL4 [Nannochloropsis gaditana CCMP526]
MPTSQAMDTPHQEIESAAFHLINQGQILQPEKEGDLPMLRVSNPYKADADHAGAQNVVLAVGHVVTTRVLRITSKQAYVEILALGSVVLRQTCQGIIKKEDVSDHDIDRIEIPRCFRPGDIVRARVVSLGDSRQYYLKTAESELGVVYARSQTQLEEGGAEGGGRVMVPVSWEAMMDPLTKATEPRKVAKPSAKTD